MSEKFLNVETQDQAVALVARANKALPELDARGRDFIVSLLAQDTRKAGLAPMRRLSGVQWWWMNELAERAERTQAPVVRETAPLGDMKGVIRLFDVAAQHLKKPGITLGMTAEAGDTLLVRLKPASASDRVPNSINVVREDGVWLGRILREGRFELSSRDKDAAKEVVPALQRFAADPITGAKASARLTGRCAFCNTGLKDERSTSVGYGPICAAHWDLPWGN
jgi:hypothetical protein